VEHGIFNMDYGVRIVESGKHRVCSMENGVRIKEYGMEEGGWEWKMDSGIWDTEHGTLNMKHGIWNMDYGVWSVTYGGLRMEHGVWSIEYGL